MEKTVGKLFAEHPLWEGARLAGIARMGGETRFLGWLGREALGRFAGCRVLAWWLSSGGEGADPVPAVLFRFPEWRGRE